MPRLKVQEVATKQGKRLTDVQFDVRLPMATVRRYWYGTSDGKTDGKPLTEVDLNKLSAFAKALGVKIADLIEDERATLALVGSQPYASARA